MVNPSRRTMLRHGLLATGGLLVDFHSELLADSLPGGLGEGLIAGLPEPDDFRPVPFLEFKKQGEVVFYCPRVEMGQGIMTALTQLVAEELGSNPNLFIVVQAPNSRAFGNNKLFGTQSTGGSTSIQDSFDYLRVGSARIRGLFIQAASKKLKLKPEDLEIKDFHVRSSQGEWPFKDFLVEAAQLSLPKTVPISREKYKFIGQSFPRVDSNLKVTGRATYGLDVVVPNMRIAVVLRHGLRGTKLKGFEASVLNDKPGFLGAYVISTGLALIFDKYWRAKQYLELFRDEIKLDWEMIDPYQFSSSQEYLEKMSKEKKVSARSDGSVHEVFSKTDKVHEATYSVPYQPHLTMEPQNCTARLTPELAEIWAPIQFVTQAEDYVQEITGLKKEQIKIYNTAVGGGFGRRLETDFVHEAVEIAKLSKLVVKVIWSREDDIGHDFYRPAALHRLKFAWNEQGEIAAWSHQVASQSILKQRIYDLLKAASPDWLPNMLRNAAGSSARFLLDKTGMDPTLTEGAADWPYRCENIEVLGYPMDSPVSVGFWRSVGFSHNIFAREGMINEFCAMTGKDPLKWRFQELTGDKSFQKVLQGVGKISNWDSPLTDEFTGRGVAVANCYGSYIAMVIQVQVVTGILKVTDVFVSLDCGYSVNPRGVEDQIISASIFALSAALYGNLTFENSRVVQTNFDRHPILKINDTPRFQIDIIKSDAPPQGVGEVGVVTVAPALSAAIHQVIGLWKREMPFCKEGNKI